MLRPLSHFALKYKEQFSIGYREWESMHEVCISHSIHYYYIGGLKQSLAQRNRCKRLKYKELFSMDYREWEYLARGDSKRKK